MTRATLNASLMALTEEPAMTRRDTKPLELNDLGIYIPMDQPRPSRTKRIVWILACLAMVCGGLVAFSDFEMPQI